MTSVGYLCSFADRIGLQHGTGRQCGTKAAVRYAKTGDLASSLCCWPALWRALRRVCGRSSTVRALAWSVRERSSDLLYHARPQLPREHVLQDCGVPRVDCVGSVASYPL